MNIEGLDYNTQRQSLLMPEYGREIQKMVDYAVSLPDRNERLRCAKTIVKMMETKVPQIRENVGYQQTLWDHLYLMSGKQLDIDWPYDLGNAERMNVKPEPMSLPQKDIRLRHYGRLVESMLDKLKDMSDSPQRDELIRLTANQMKRDLMQWGHGSIDDEKVIDDMARLSDGAVQADLKLFQVNRQAKPAAQPTSKKNKKRK